jgi:hypothetical protein
MRPLLLLLPLLVFSNRDVYGADAPQFEVASLKPNTSPGSRVWLAPPVGDTFTATNVTLQNLITLAYQVKPLQNEGGPNWIRSDRFDISAKPPAGPSSVKQSLMMLQALLEDCFHLMARRETREVPVYALDRPVIAKTAYTGAFDVHLEFSPRGRARIGVAPVPNPDNNSPTIFTALQEQLGLKLESQKGTADLLVVDHAEKPSED